jgi:hypothetical protein
MTTFKVQRNTNSIDGRVINLSKSHHIFGYIIFWIDMIFLVTDRCVRTPSIPKYKQKWVKEVDRIKSLKLNRDKSGFKKILRRKYFKKMVHTQKYI